jgi:hypothetical protein
MATSTPFTRITASRYGFAAMDIVINRASTPDARTMVSTLLQNMAQTIDAETNEYVLEKWAEAGAAEDGFTSFMLETHTQHWDDAFSVSIKHYLVRDKC